jgi:hypothetical protein
MQTYNLSCEEYLSVFDLSKITESVVAMDIAGTEELTEAAIDASIRVEEILNMGLIPYLYLGRRQK